MNRFGRTGSGIAVALAIGVAVACPSATAATSRAASAAPGLSCAAGDDWFDYAYVADPTGGAAVAGLLCKDHVTTGDYWAVEIEDTQPDGKCAHAAAIWRPASGNPVSDNGMYVCGEGATAFFQTPVRNWTKYSSTELDAFVDSGSSNSAPPYKF